MAVFGKIRTTIFATFLTLAFSHSSFAVTGGLDYYLGVFNEPPAETMVELGRGYPSTTPDTETHITPGAWVMPKEGQGAMDLSLGRIEYMVRVNGTASYKTLFKVRIMDSQAGPTNCVFEFLVNVEDHAGGPRAVVASATANGHDSEEFAGGPGTSNLRCQVAPIAGRGPSMYIYSDRRHIQP
jgi:hypothetical protein